MSKFRLSSSSVCITSTAYTSLCRGLKYLLKIGYIILDYSGEAEFLISYTVFLLQDGKTSLCLKIISQKYLQYLRLVTHSFTKLSQYMCSVNTHILMYQYDRGDCKLWNTLRFYSVFWVFSYIIDEH